MSLTEKRTGHTTMPLTKKLFSIDFYTGSTDRFIEAVMEKSRARQSSCIYFANVHMVVEAHRSTAFARIISRADLIAPDGMPLVKCLNHFHRLRQPRIDGMTLLPQLLCACEARQQSVFFYGGTENLLQRTKLLLERNYPHLPVAGMYAPPFRPLSPAEEEDVARMITASSARLVFVVLGCPKQEQWMDRMKGRIPAVMLGIGAALPVLVGLRKRAPLWMQRACLECLYRIAQEPGRLLKRYAVTNTIFLRLLAGALWNNARPKQRARQSRPD